MDTAPNRGHVLCRFMLDEEVLPLGAAMHTALALEWLETNAGDHDEL